MSEKEYLKKRDEKALSSKLAELQDKCKTRLLSVDDCVWRLMGVDNYLYISKKAKTGTKVVVHASMSKLPNSYKYQADSTKAVFIFDGKRWCFMTAYRDRMLQKHSYDHCEIELSDTAKEAVLKRFEIC